MAAKIVSRGEIFQLSGRLWPRRSAQQGDVHPRLHELDSLPFDDDLLSYYYLIPSTLADLFGIWEQTYKVDEEGKIFTLVSGDDDGDIVVDYASAVLVKACVKVLRREEESKDVEEQHERRWRWEHLNLNLESTAGRRRSLLPAHLYFHMVEGNAEGFVWPPKEMLQSFMRVGVSIEGHVKQQLVDALFGQLADDINIPGLHLIAHEFGKLDESPAWQWVDALTLRRASNAFDLLRLCCNLRHFSLVHPGTSRQPTEAENQKLVQALTQESSKLTHLCIQVSYDTDHAIAAVIQHPRCRLSRLDLRNTLELHAAYSYHEALFGALAHANESLCDLGLDIATASHLQPLLSTSSKLADFFTQRLLVLRLSIQENDDNYSEMQAVLEQLAQSLRNINNNVRFLDLKFRGRPRRKTLGRTFWHALLPPDDQSTAASPGLINQVPNLQYAGNNPNKPAATALLQALRIAPPRIVQVAGGLADYLGSPLCPLLRLELRIPSDVSVLEPEEEWELANSLSDNFSLCTLSLPGYEWSNPEAKARAHSVIERNLRYKAGQLLQEESVHPTVARVFLCGHGEAGKTTLCRSLLLTQKSALRQAAASAWSSKAPRRTRGMEFHPLHFNKLGVSTKLLICDLGGQQEFHSFHHYMMNATHNDLFIVVCKLPNDHLPQEQFERELLYWLKFIVVHRRVGAYNTSGSSSTSPLQVKPKVLVVVNFFFKTENMPTIAHSRAQELMRVFSEVLDFGGSADQQQYIYANLFGISAKKITQVQAVKERLETLLKEVLESGRRIPQLCSRISQEVLPALQERKPSRFHFLQRSKPALFANFEEILQKCARHLQLPTDNSNLDLSTVTRVQAALMELHNQGLLLFFPKKEVTSLGEIDHRTLVITDSGWFCHKFIGELLAVYIEERELNRHHDPSIRRIEDINNPSIWRIEDIQSMLRSQDCKEEHLGEMVRYLQDLELCFEMEHKDGVDRNAQDSSSRKMLLFPALVKQTVIVYPKVVSENYAGGSENSEIFFGRRLKCKKSSYHLIPSGVFTRLQVRLCTFSKNECYELGYCWASFMKGRVGAMVRFGGNVVNEPWENKAWIDILVFSPRIVSSHLQQQEFEANHRYLIAAENLMRQIKDVIYEICQSTDYTGIPSVTLQEWVLPHKQPHPLDTELAVIKKDLKEQGLQDCVVNWRSNVGIPPTPVVELLLPTELEEYVSSQLTTLASIRAEFSFGSSVDDIIGGYGVSQQSSDGGKGKGKMTEVRAESDDDADATRVESKSHKQLAAELKRFIRQEFERFDRLQQERFESLKLDLHNMNLALQLIRKDIQSLGRYLQETKRDIISHCSTRLVEHELIKVDHAHPLYPYLVDAKSGKLKSLMGMKKARLHFMCESPDDGPHPVQEQRGKEITIGKKWHTKVARVMIPAFCVLCCLARIGATVLLPGAHVFIPSPDWLEALGIERDALQHVILPKALETLLDGVPDVNPKHLLTQQAGSKVGAKEMMETLQTILGNENIDMASDFALQRYHFGGNKVHWVCKHHKPKIIGASPLKSPNPFKSISSSS